MLAKAGNPLGVGAGCPVSCLRRLRMSRRLVNVRVDSDSMNVLFCPPDGIEIASGQIPIWVNVDGSYEEYHVRVTAVPGTGRVVEWFGLTMLEPFEDADDV